jgi:hypothetical protein
MLECIHNKNVLMLIFFLGRNEKKKKKKEEEGREKGVYHTRPKSI